MTKAIDTTTTIADPFWAKFHKAEAGVSEAELHALVGDAAAFSREVWSKPAATLEDLRRPATPASS